MSTKQETATPMPTTNFANAGMASQQNEDTRQFLEALRKLAQPAQADEPKDFPAARSMFRWQLEGIRVSRAPGRLDVMGGIADYSGSLVLQMPIQEACHVAVQRHAVDTQPCWEHVSSRHNQKGGRRAVLQMVSFNADPDHRQPTFDVDLEDLFPGGSAMPYEQACHSFKSNPSTSWAAYAAGVLLVLNREKGVLFQDGLSILISSDVPEGKGVSSSASVEVAVMMAVSHAYSISLEDRELALLCQKVENLVVGAPCGIMDQMSSALCQSRHLLMLLCQPAQVLGHAPIPEHIAFWGVDSGVRHSVAGADYGSVRIGAFMGLRIVSELAAQSSSSGNVTAAGEGEVQPIRGGYLANINPSEFAQRFLPHLPDSITGKEFLERYHTHFDPVTTIEPDRRYAVRSAASHPVHESLRVRLFQQLLLAPKSSSQLELLGELMFQSHDSYSACGLGSDGTDRLVDLVRAHIADARASGRQPLLHGAKITGGGCGGTVCLLGESTEEAAKAVQCLVAQYNEEMKNNHPYVFCGSSSGAAAFGTMSMPPVHLTQSLTTV